MSNHESDLRKVNQFKNNFYAEAGRIENFAHSINGKTNISKQLNLSLTEQDIFEESLAYYLAEKGIEFPTQFPTWLWANVLNWISCSPLLSRSPLTDADSRQQVVRRLNQRVEMLIALGQPDVQPKSRRIVNTAGIISSLYVEAGHDLVTLSDMVTDQQAFLLRVIAGDQF